MRALDRKLARDLLRMRGQVITIALVLAAGVAATVALTGTYRALSAARDDYYARHGFPDVFVQVARTPDAMASRLATLPGVATVTPRLVEPLAAWMPGLPRPATGAAISLPEDGSLRGLVLRQGRAPDPLRADEVVMLESFARAHGLGPDDRQEVIMAGRRHRLRIVGTVLSPEHVFPVGAGVIDPTGVVVVWMPRAALAARLGAQGTWNDATFTLVRGTDARAVIAAIDRALAPWGGRGAYGRDQQTSHRFVSQELEQLKVMATRVPVVFLLVAAFLLNVVLGRLVQLQREQLAVLRALGYRRTTIARHVGAFAAVIVGLGAVLGVGGGVAVGRAMTSLYQRFFHFPALAFHLETDLLALALAVSAGATVAGALVAMRRVLRMTPAEAMRAPAPARYRRGVLGWRPLARLAGPLGRMIVRELERRPLGLAASVAGVGFAVAIVIVGRFSRDSLDRLLDDVMARTMREDVAVMLARPTPVRELSWFTRAPGVLAAEPALVVPVRLTGPRGHRDVAILGLRHDARLRHVRDGRGQRLPIPLDGLLMSEILARRLGVVVGDRVRVQRQDGDRAERVLPVAATVDDHLGLQVYLDLDGLAAAFHQAPQLSQVFLTVDRTQRDRLLAALADVPDVAQVTEVASFRDAFAAQSGSSMTFFTLVVVCLGAVIAIGVVYNNARVALSERARDLATLRVLGYHRREVAVVLVGQLAIQIAIAVPLGMFFGTWMAAALMATADPEAFRFPVTISRQTYGFAALVIGGAALATAALVRRRLDRLDPNDALKARD